MGKCFLESIIRNVFYSVFCLVVFGCVGGIPSLVSGLRSFNDQCVGIKLSYPKSLKPSDPRGFETLLRDLTVRSGRTVFFAQQPDEQAMYSPTLVIRVLNTPILDKGDINRKLEVIMTTMRQKTKQGTTSKITKYEASGKQFFYFDVSIDENNHRLTQRITALANNNYLIMIFLNTETSEQLAVLQSIINDGIGIYQVSEERENSDKCKQMRNLAKPKIQKIKK